MVKKYLLTMIALLCMLGGANAQNVAEEQMDERFNDGGLPYGWFTEGWEVKDGVIQSKSSGMGSLFGGDDKDNYLLTPPLVVKEGETLVLSAKKKKSDDSSSSISFGSSDSTFVVERTEYSKNQWVRVADFTTELDTVYKSFTIEGTSAGEYRFRLKAAGEVFIDSIAGFHFDSDAPDIYVVDGDVRARDVDFSLCEKDSTHTLTVINTATGTLKVTASSSDEGLFSVSPKELEVAAADSLDVDITFNFAAGRPGRNEAEMVFTPADTRVYGKSLVLTAVVTQPGVWMEDFNTCKQPVGFFTEGWEFRDSVATVSSGGGMGAMFGGGESYFLMTPPLTVESTDEVLLFSAKLGGDDGLGGLFGGGGSPLVMEKSVYGSNKWEKVKEFDKPDSDYKVLWISYIEPGEYRFRIVASDSIVVDSIAGFHLDNNAPDMYVIAKNTNFGMPQANSTKPFAVVNTGTGSLDATVEGSDEKVFALSEKNLSIAAGDTAVVDVTYLYDEQSLGEHLGTLTFKPLPSVLSPWTLQLAAYSTYPDAWKEDFEPEFIPDDETLPREFPEGWETTGWEVRLPSSDGGLMDMLMDMLGSGGEEQDSWMATTGSVEYELITPQLQAQKGDALRFDVKMEGSGGLMDMFSMFMGGDSSPSGLLNVFYSRDNDEEWTLYNSYTQSDSIFFVAPYTGLYRLRFTAENASLDNFYGLRVPAPYVCLYEDNDNTNMAVLEEYNGQKVNVSYDRVLSAVGEEDGTWTPKAYTICLPYDLNFDDYYGPGKVKLYQMSYLDNYYQQFIFTNVEGKAEAGKAYLVVVEQGDLNLNAYDVTLASEPVSETDESTVVGDYEDWYFDEKLTKVGCWTGSFKSITDKEADEMNMYCVRDNGSWARFKTDPNGEDTSLGAFRAFFLKADAPENGRRYAPAKLKSGEYRTMLQQSDANVNQSGNTGYGGRVLFNGDIPYPVFKQLLGDVNGDGVISIIDVTMLVDYIMGEHSRDFVEENADANQDNIVSITDLTETVNKILGNDSSDMADNSQANINYVNANRSLVGNRRQASSTKWTFYDMEAISPEGQGGCYSWSKAPSIRTIESDGKVRQFDIQGRLMDVSK